MIGVKKTYSSLPSKHKLKEFINNNSLLQQCNYHKIINIQQYLTDQQSFILKKDNHSIASSNDDQRKQYFRFNHPNRNYIHHRKIIHKNKTKKTTKCHDKNHADNLMRKMPNSSFNPLHEDSFRTWLPCIQDIFLWMMEFASLLKITKNAYFRSILILQRAIQADSRIAHNRITDYACAALSIGCKYECSGRNYLSEIFIAYSRRVSKNEIIRAESRILTAIKWCIPVQILVQEDLCEIIRQWGQFLRQNKEEIDRNMYIKCYFDNQSRAISKFYIQIVYILDFLILKRKQDWLKEDSFIQPILISLYILFSINIGDMHLDQHGLWPHFQHFIIDKDIYHDPTQIKHQIDRCFSEFKIIEVLGQIPLNLNFEKIIRKKNEQFFIPKIS